MLNPSVLVWDTRPRQDVEDVVNDQYAIITFPVSGSSVPLAPSSDNPRPALYGASSAPSSSIYRSPKEQPGVSHRANDVRNDRWSFDTKNQTKHQAYDANPKATPTAREYSPVLSRPRVPTFNHPVHPSHSGTTADLTQTGREQCHCVGGPLNLAPLRDQHQEDQRQREGPIPNEVYPRTSHVPPSHLGRSHPPNIPSSAYLRPNPQMLFK